MIYRTAAQKRELAEKLKQHWPEFLEVLVTVKEYAGPAEWIEVKRNEQ